jgi:hypothetical protein
MFEEIMAIVHDTGYKDLLETNYAPDERWTRDHNHRSPLTGDLAIVQQYTQMT